MKKKEYAIGETFSIGFLTFKVVEGKGCEGCELKDVCCSVSDDEQWGGAFGSCVGEFRKDGTDVLFVKVNGNESEND